MCADAAPEGGALLQMQDGSLWSYHCNGQQGFSPLGPALSFPVPCPCMVLTPLTALQQLGEIPCLPCPALPCPALPCPALPWEVLVSTRTSCAA